MIDCTIVLISSSTLENVDDAEADGDGDDDDDFDNDDGGDYGGCDDGRSAKHIMFYQKRYIYIKRTGARNLHNKNMESISFDRALCCACMSVSSAVASRASREFGPTINKGQP